MLKVTINGNNYEVPEGTNVLDAAQAHGEPLEHFCYHRYLPVDGNCRTCMVEIEGPRGRALTIACNQIVTDGMVVHTTSPVAAQAQKSALEFLLLDHPLDCPVCDKAGECKLQNHYLNYGRYDFRRSVARSFKGGKALDIGKHIVLDQERCILCTRCIRFLDNIPKTSELCIIHRGHEATLTTFPGLRLDNPYSGNVTDVCPVGALTLKEFRFKQRVWLLKKSDSVCDGCARGCNITIEHNRGRVWRYMPRENPRLNRYWMCDEGRFSFGKHHQDRLKETRQGGRPIGFDEAFDRLVSDLSQCGPQEVAAVASPFSALEDNWALQQLFKDHFHPGNLAAYVPGPSGEGDEILRLREKYPNEAGLKLLSIPMKMDALLKKMESGAIKVLIVLENDLLGLDPKRFQKAMSKVPCVVVLSSHVNPTVDAATLAFPMRTFAEKYGTFVNATGRLQRFHRAFDPACPGVLPSSTWLAKLASRLGVSVAVSDDPRKTFDAMARDIDGLKGMTFKKIPRSGQAVALGLSVPEPFKDLNANPNVLPGHKGIVDEQLIERGGSGPAKERVS